MHPLDSLCSWFDSQETIVRNRIAFLVTASFPTEDGELSRDAFDEPEVLFRKWIGQRGHYLQDVARAVTARALVSFLVMRHEENGEAWDRTRQLYEAVLKSDSSTENMVHLARQKLSEMPSEMETWAKAYSSWRDLCESQLSDRSVDAWEREASNREMKSLNLMSQKIEIR